MIPGITEKSFVWYGTIVFKYHRVHFSGIQQNWIFPKQTYNTTLVITYLSGITTNFVYAAGKVNSVK